MGIAKIQKQQNPTSNITIKEFRLLYYKIIFSLKEDQIMPPLLLELLTIPD